jgi:hypothetical protein
MKVELKETLEKELKEGMNLFLGAGFSIYAKDQNNASLPIGSVLCEELVKEFKCPDIKDLSKVCTIIDSFNSEGLKSYLLKRFDVATLDDSYFNILKHNIPRIFTTNIDNLVQKIFERSESKYLNNILKNGACFQDPNCIDFIPLHGSIEYPEDKFLFNMQEVSSSFRIKRNAWASLSLAAEQIPSIFLGYSLNDVGVIEALYGQDTKPAEQKNKWIVLRSENPGSEAYFKALGFKIIIADVKEFLEYLGTLTRSKEKTKEKSKDHIYEIFPDSRIPQSTTNLKIRPIEEFFLGDAPIWSDVLSNRIYKTSHLDKIINAVEHRKHIIVTGIPASGKSTLMLQLARNLSRTKRVLIFNDITINKASIIKNEIETPSIILIDNFTTDIDAFVALEKSPNIQLIGFDRYYNVDISSHRIDYSRYEFLDVSDLSPQDIQGIYDTIPLGIRKSPMVSKTDKEDIPSTFEIVNFNINKPNINERYAPILDELETKDPFLLELLIMTCYLHSCRVPVSFEVANSFLSEDGFSYSEILGFMESLKGMVNEVIGNVIDGTEDQDYFQPRSQILAETILRQTKSYLFKSVYKKFHDNVPKHLIPRFYIFKRSAYDAYYTTKAFNNWQEGLEFYENIFANDRTPFVLQQCSLYLLKKKKYIEAALKIDHAIQISTKRIFSIENTHAIVLFKANIHADKIDSKTRETLDNSMQILRRCYQEDQRKTYHAMTFAEQSLEYFSVFGDNTAKQYLELSLKWLQEIEVERKYNNRVRNLLSEIKRIL